MIKNPCVSALVWLAAAGNASAWTLQSQVMTVTLDPAKGTLGGEAEMTLAGEESPVVLRLGAPFALEKASLIGADGRSRPLETGDPVMDPPGPDGLSTRRWSLALPKPAAGPVVLRLAWGGTPPGLPENVKFSRDEVTGLSAGYLAPEGAFLPPSAGWYPQIPEAGGLVKLTARVPAVWRVVSEGRRVDNAVEKNGVWRRESFDPGAPLEGVHLVAAPWKVRESTDEPKVSVFSLPDTPDEMVQTYLLAAQKYILRFSAEIGAHAWPQYTIAEHILPTGYGMPSFTLLGAGVIRLPFIVKTSLGHEVLHDWWGNGVYVDYSQGNWCEGLTAYMADHAFAGESSPGGDREYRLQILRDYAEYFAGLDPAKEPALASFRERADRRDRALGYGKSAMVFHMLRKMAGDDLFRETLRGFFHDYKYRKAGWGQIEAAFSRALGRDLRWFFDQWVRRPGAPSLTLASATLRDGGGEYLLDAELRVDGIWSLSIPLEVTGADSTRLRRGVDTTDGKAYARWEVPFLPQTLVADPDIDLFRRLPPEQLPATLARLLADPPDLVVIGTARGEDFATAARNAGTMLGQGKAPTRLDREVQPQELAGARKVWLVGRPGPEFARQIAARWPPGFALEETVLRVAGTAAEAAGAAAVIVLDHPRPGAGALGIVDALAAADLVVTARKVAHYGKYSWLLFSNGQAVVKGVASPGADPLVRNLAPLPRSPE